MNIVVQDILKKEHKGLSGMLEMEERNLEMFKRRVVFAENNIRMYIEKMKQIDDELEARGEESDAS